MRARSDTSSPHRSSRPPITRQGRKASATVLLPFMACLFLLFPWGDIRWTALLYYRERLHPSALERTRLQTEGVSSESILATDSDPLQALIAQVSPDRLRDHICKLQDDDRGEYCNDQGSRYILNTAGQHEARSYIHGAFLDQGLDVVYDPFQRSDEMFYNVVASKPGQDPQSDLVYILCAHYDSISPVARTGGPAPGADDNGSGVAALLEVARVLNSQTFSHTIRFIAFTGEEVGFWGSTHYAAEAARRGEQIAGVINLDMIGYDGDGDRLIELHAGTNPASIGLADIMIETIQQQAINLTWLKYTIGACDRSDHAPFWAQGYPAILVIESYYSGDSNPHYHQVTDTLDHVELSYVADLAKAAVGTMARLARLLSANQSYIILCPRVVISGP